MSPTRQMPHPRRVLVTGATGFVGRALVEELVLRGHIVTALSRRTPLHEQTSAHRCVALDLSTAELPEDLLSETDVIIHLAARVHDRRSSPKDFEAGTVAVARNVAQPAARARVPRTVLISSIGARLAENQATVREYGAAKLRAETEFRDHYVGTACQLVILRPPVVYGPDAPGSFGTLVRWIRRGRPLPFGLATAPRYYLSRRSLVELICELVTADDDQWHRANGLAFEPSDLQPISTRDLAISLAQELNCRAWLVPVPRWLMVMGASILGKKELIYGALNALPTQTTPSLKAHFNWQAREQIGETPVFRGPSTGVRH